MKKQTQRRSIATRRHSLILFGVFAVAAAAVTLPLYSVRSSPARPGAASAYAGTKAMQSGQIGSLSANGLGPSSLRTLLSAPQASSETIETFASDCTTPQTDFNLGATVCAKISGAPLPVDGRAQRRIGWVSPYGSLAQGADITTDPQNGTYQIPTTQKQTFTDSGGGTVVVDNRGTWSVNTFSAADGSRRASAYFTVH